MKSLLMSVVATVGIALCALGIASVPAAATPAYQAVATPYQNEAIAAAMASYPGGTRISASTVEWGDGAEFISVARPGRRRSVSGNDHQSCSRTGRCGTRPDNRTARAG